MKRKRHVAYLLLLASIFMLAVPVFPHHHHADGLICMKSDLAEDGCEHHHQETACGHGQEHCCCNTGCVTTHFFQSVSQPDNHNIVLPSSLLLSYLEPLLRGIMLPENRLREACPIYIESLHGTFITRATGLRAPPSVLA